MLNVRVAITKAGRCLLCHNHSQIPPRTLRNLMDVSEIRVLDVINKWQEYFGEIEYYC